jgi:putative colanic acid biosynthesis UDP-glucose lipid carrier transferase
VKTSLATRTIEYRAGSLPAVLPASRSSGWIRPYSLALVELSRVGDAILIVAMLWLLSGWLDTPWTPVTAGVGWLASLIFVISGSANHLYRSWRSDSLLVEVLRIGGCWGIAAVGTGFAAFLFEPVIALPRLLAACWFVATPVALGATRIAVRLTLRIGRRRGHNYRRTAIIGSTHIARHVAESIRNAPWMGLKLVGFYDDRSPADERVVPITAGPLRGTVSDLMRHAEAGEVDQVYVALPLRAEIRIKSLIDQLAEIPNISILYVPDFFVFNMLHASWEQVGNLHAINVVSTPFLGVSGLAKRIEDIVFSSIILALIAAPLVVIALAIRLTSAGPVIFRQRRYGLNGKEFEIWKFRTMTVCEDGADFVQAQRGDSRVTPLGRFLRATSLDELPQFINVLQGRMSIVGPRPHPIALDDKHRRLIPNYVFRQKIRPGITGLAQVRGFRGETETVDKMARRIASDIEYIDCWSLTLDLKIIALTVLRGFRNENAF